LAGKNEGDGAIVTPDARRTASGRKNDPHIQVAFNIKDMELARKL
jgi:hypothetical protein